jgi:mono/diheme cytochrome c family protein
MRRVWKIVSVGVGLCVFVAASTVLAGYANATSRRARTVPVPGRDVAVPDDPETKARGAYLYASRGCADCHGLDGAGRTYVEADGIRLAGPDITPAGTTAAYQPKDWDRALRHGIKPDGRPLFMMPSEDYARLTDDDLGALVAHVRSLTRGAGRPAVLEVPPIVTLLYGFGVIEDAAAKIDHEASPSVPVERAVTVEHGAYVAQMCRGCHGSELVGGPIPGAPPDWPPAANLTPGEGSGMVRYRDAEAFVTMLRSGKRPDGTPIAVMPFAALRELDDTDARAIYAFLASLPPRDPGAR